VDARGARVPLKATLLGLWLAVALAVHLGAHVGLLFGLAQRRPRWRALAALVVPPLAPMWGWNAMPRRARAWLIAFGAYAVVIVAAR
jgi:hypothetical protein